MTAEWLASRRLDRDLPPPVGQVEIVEYDPAWPDLTNSHEKRIREAHGPAALAVERIGSISPAKPRIDIDVILADPADEPNCLRMLDAGLGEATAVA